jgi:hypothetical protein
MARKKRTSSVLEAAHRRLAGLKSITPAPDYGSTLSLAGYSTQITDFSTRLDSYNQMVSTLDDLQNQLDAEENKLNETNKRMLSATGGHDGPDSSEYEQTGGTRLSDRKRPPDKENAAQPRGLKLLVRSMMSGQILSDKYYRTSIV